ncbi:hypothetical protein EDC96DRAFT_540623 [Choanephora cucurbitarum]|nr:hypothetical protein EDC96DRAFT_540623 [Choanephora cucurbitarum]
MLENWCLCSCYRTQSCKRARKTVASFGDNDDDSDDDDDVDDNDTVTKRFLQDFFSYCINLLKKKDVAAALSQSEANFNLFVLWPLMDLAAGDLKFCAGEYVLLSSKEEYKADACIVDNYKNEICLLETSNGLLCGDMPKYGYDHVKGAFGALTMFNAAFKKYHKVDYKVAQQLSILFVHARDDCIHLWSLELCSKKVYALKKVYVAKLVTSNTESSQVVALGNLVWKMKTMLMNIVRVLEKMKKSHDNNTMKMMMEGKCTSSLVDYVDIDIQKPVRGAGYGILLPEEKEDDDIVVNYVE